LDAVNETGKTVKHLQATANLAGCIIIKTIFVLAEIAENAKFITASAIAAA